MTPPDLTANAVPVSLPRTRRPGNRYCEQLEARLVLSAVASAAASASPAVPAASDNLLDAKNGPLANAGVNLINLYVNYRRAQKAAVADGTVAAFDVSADPMTNNPAVAADPDLEIVGQDVGVEIRPRNASDPTFASDLTAAGVKVQYQTDGVVEGLVPITLLRDVAQRSDVFSITPVMKALALQQGSTPNQADTIMNIAQVRSQFGVNGTGKTIGVISDSVNQVGGGISDSVRTGDLPNDVDVIQDGQPGDTDEGRAMLEEIYDLAPGAGLAFSSGDGGQQAFAHSITNLVNEAGANVIVDDLLDPSEPFFQPGIVDDAISTVVSEGVSYFSAAGNDGFGGIQQAPAFVSSGGNQLVNFTAGSGTTTRLSITIPDDGDPDFHFLALQWDQPYNGIAGNATTELDMNIFDSNGNLVDTENTNSVATGIPEQLDPLLNPGTYQIEIGQYGANVSQPKPDLIKLVGDFSINTAGVAGIQSAIFGHQGNGATIAVGAISADMAAQTPLDNDSYSVDGPGTQIFDQNGNRLPSPITHDEPLITGVDGVTTSFFGQPSDLGPFTFFGTSAAAPNVAALAALMLQLNPTLTQSQIATALKVGAQPLNGAAAGTWDPQGGFGLVNGLAAVASIAPTVSGPIATIAQVTPNPHTTAVASIPITFSQPVTGFTISSLSLTLNGGTTNLLSGAQTLTGSGTSYMLNNLALLTATQGVYTLTLTAAGSGIVGTGGAALASSASMTWVFTTTGTPPTPPRRPPGGGPGTPTRVPSQAAPLNAKGYTKHSILLTWSNNGVQTDADQADYYVIIVRSLDKHFKTGVTKVKLDETPQFFVDGGLREGTRYYYRIYTGDTLGLGPASSVMFAETLPAKAVKTTK